MSLTKKDQRLRRARQTRLRIALQQTARLAGRRANLHIDASSVSGDGARVLASAATLAQTPPKVVKKVPPEFPAEAVRKNINAGSVKAKLTIGADDHRQAHRREGQGSGDREGRVRPLGFCLPRSRQGAGRGGA